MYAILVEFPNLNPVEEDSSWMNVLLTSNSPAPGFCCLGTSTELKWRQKTAPLGAVFGVLSIALQHASLAALGSSAKR